MSTDGQILGWAPTVNEINHLLDIFDEIYHASMLYHGVAPASTMAYKSNKIKFIEIPSSGGKTFTDKFRIIFNAPKTIGIISTILKKVDYFQLRTPTGIGTYLIPYLTLFSKKQGWYKYAGNWNQNDAPLSYALQRFLLKYQRRKVTINGEWKNQPAHCITFENPCLTEDNINEGKSITASKKTNGKLSFCYVGRLETPKGVGRIIKAFKNLEPSLKDRVEAVHLVGDGTEKSKFLDLANDSKINFKFYGFLDRKDVFDIYKKSHFFLMPTTASEGFPKVIAEAMNFGCIPVVSNISSIAQYVIDRDNGILLSEVTAEKLEEVLADLLSDKPDNLTFKMTNQDLVLKFSYDNYNSKIVEGILTSAAI